MIKYVGIQNVCRLFSPLFVAAEENPTYTDIDRSFGAALIITADKEASHMKLKSIRQNYNHTVYAAYIGYITQAIINNFAPLLFLTFESSYSIPLSKITLLVTVNFGIQLLVDLLCAKIVDKIGYRPCIVAAHLFAGAGLICLGILPDILPDPYIGIIIAIALYAVGGGLTEVLISPIVEACPSERKEAAMSLLHSFYCWGHVFVILVSTAFFTFCGIDNWKILAILWALVPLLNAIYFSLVPIRQLGDGENGEGHSMSLRELAGTKIFWLFVVLMLCAGASEQAMSQWASAFAEAGLGVSKSIGDLAGPCMFAILMGSARALYAKLSNKINLRLCMSVCCVTCIAGYLLAALSPLPLLSLVGCGLCGFSVGIMWPGTFSMASLSCPRGGTAMFALLALAGDLGCSAGPSTVGFIADIGSNSLKTGMLFAIIFTVLLLIGLIILKKKRG